MRNRLLTVMLLALFLAMPAVTQAEGAITAESYLLVEKDTLSIIDGKDYHRELPPASTAKVMTSILALEKLSRETTIVPTRQVVNLPSSKLNLFPGKPYRATDLVNAALVKSANDAAYALSVSIAGSEENFADMMNKKAQEIGASNTHFVNASGLNAPGQHTSCWDLALMFRYALANEEFREIVGTKYYLFRQGNRDERLMNHNRFLFCFEPAIGGKTGFTRLAKHCYVGAFEKDGKVYILSLLGSRNLWGDAVNILKALYDDLPSERELHMARATTASLASYTVSTRKTTAYRSKQKKQSSLKGKQKRARKGRVKLRTT